MTAASAVDYRELARRRIPTFLFEYFDGGSYAEVTMARNIHALRTVQLRQRVLCDVSAIDLESTLFDQRFAMPVILGPIGLAGMASRRGEIKAARAAENAGVPFTLSTVSVCSITELASATQKPFWFQLYMIRDRAFMIDLLVQARQAGCTALVFTVDMPVPGSRYRDYRSGLAGASNWRGAIRRVAQGAARPGWAWDVGINGRPHSLGNIAPLLGSKSGLEDFIAWMNANFDPSVTWRDLDFLRSHWDGPIIIKGILDAEDAEVALDCGCDGIVVSNHGGRQLDGTPATAEALGPIVEKVAGRAPVLVDGGVRSGLDVIRMLALGAKGVLLGRVWAFALAAGGERAVAHVLRLIEAEMRLAMALTGVTSIDAISSKILVPSDVS